MITFPEPASAATTPVSDCLPLIHLEWPNALRLFVFTFALLLPERRELLRQVAAAGALKLFPGRIYLKRRALAFNQPLHPLHERLRLHRPFSLVLDADTHVDLTRLHLAVAEHELERHLLHRVLADLGVHLLVAQVNMHSHSGGLQLVAD